MIRLTLDDTRIFEGKLASARVFDIARDLSVGLHSLTLEYTEKTNRDVDQAIEIDYIDFERITADRFVWAGEYTPNYPEPWASEQRALGIELSERRSNVKFLGWNGVWRLDFETPIFSWIHRIENLGWVYD